MSITKEQLVEALKKEIEQQADERSDFFSEDPVVFDEKVGDLVEKPDCVSFDGVLDLGRLANLILNLQEDGRVSAIIEQRQEKKP